MIEVIDLGKSFGEVQALRNLTFSIPPGEIFGLLGLNGAGKTTCLRILSTVLTPSTGCVRLLGEDPFVVGLSLRKKLGVLSSETHLPGRFSPLELAEMASQLYDLKDWRSHFLALAESLDMIDFTRRPVGTFSTGMKQKTALALTFLHDPPLLLLDEPTAGLDIPSARTIRDFLHARILTKTVLICSHHLHEVEALCHRVGILHRGKLIAEGELHNLLSSLQAPSLEEAFLKALQNAP